MNLVQKSKDDFYYAVDSDTKEVYFCFGINDDYFVIQVLNMQCIEKMKNGEYCMVLTINEQGKYFPGGYEYCIILLGKQHPDFLLYHKTIANITPVATVHRKVWVVMVTDGNKPGGEFLPILWPTQLAHHSQVGLIVSIFQPARDLINSIKNAPGKVVCNCELITISEEKGSLKEIILTYTN